MNQEYVPFQDRVVIESFNKDKHDKWCEYCGANMNANCHAHASYCPYYCGNDDNNQLPIGDGIGILLLFSVTYVLVKKFLLK